MLLSLPPEIYLVSMMIVELWKLLIHSSAFNVIPFLLRLILIFSVLQFGNSTGEPHGSEYFHNPNFVEATRLIELKLTLIKPQDIPKYYTLDRFPNSPYKNYPTLYFTGLSWGIHGNEATVIGSVTMTGGGVVRWRFVSPVIIIVSSWYQTEMKWGTPGICNWFIHSVEVGHGAVAIFLRLYS